MPSERLCVMRSVKNVELAHKMKERKKISKIKFVTKILRSRSFSLDLWR